MRRTALVLLTLTAASFSGSSLFAAKKPSLEERIAVLEKQTAKQAAEIKKLRTELAQVRTTADEVFARNFIFGSANIGHPVTGPFAAIQKPCPAVFALLNQPHSTAVVPVFPGETVSVPGQWTMGVHLDKSGVLKGVFGTGDNFPKEETRPVRYALFAKCP